MSERRVDKQRNNRKDKGSQISYQWAAVTGYIQERGTQGKDRVGQQPRLH